MPENKTPETYTLLIWEEVPEDTKLYLIPNERVGGHRILLNMSQNHMINGGDVEEHVAASINGIQALISPTREFIPEENLKLACLWSEFKVDRAKPIANKVITHVYFTGFLL